MPPVTPASAEDLASMLREASDNTRSLSISGHNSKRLMAGPVAEAEVPVSTARLDKVLAYEPNDLTVSVEAGMPWARLQSILAGHRQMVALDPPFHSTATVGGVIASNSSGPMRRAYGTARDLVIGLQFAMLDGRLIRTGGMVVKNVAGLDMGKLLIGSFGTLAVITSVNFRLHALPSSFRTFLFPYAEQKGAIAKRDALLSSPLRPVAADLLTSAASARLGFNGHLLAIRAAGSRDVLERYARDLAGAAVLSEQTDESFWTRVREFPADFLGRQPGGVILRISTPLADLDKLLRLVSGVAISRALSGVTYVYLSSLEGVTPFWKAASENAWLLAVEFAPPEVRSTTKLWLAADADNGNAFAIMKSVKNLFDPGSLLNRSRLYGRI